MCLDWCLSELVCFFFFSFFFSLYHIIWGFLSGSVVKNPPATAWDAGSIPGWGRSPGKENGNPLQYSCLGNPMDRGAWMVTVHGVEKSWTQFSDQNNNHHIIYLSLGSSKKKKKKKKVSEKKQDMSKLNFRSLFFPQATAEHWQILF